jgi:hypothetical protein
MGPGKAFDPSRFFIFCANVLGSPYGTASPITINPETGKAYGPEFPPTTIRDDIRSDRFEFHRHGLVADYILFLFILSLCPMLPLPISSHLPWRYVSGSTNTIPSSIPASDSPTGTLLVILRHV